MGTSYSPIFDKFMKKLRGDTDFMSYKNVSQSEIDSLVEDHLLSLLNQSIDYLYEFGNPDINLYDKDDVLQKFNVDLIPQEISLISNVMYYNYMNEERNKLRVFEQTFKSSELNTLSPANERKSFLGMVSEMQSKVDSSISNYYSRSRSDWNMKSIYGGN